MNEAQIEIITCGLVSDPIPKISLLNRCGVNVRLGSDNIYDSWNPFGNGDLMERLGRVCQVFEWYDEYSLSRSLRLITGGIVPLSDDGKRIWPSIGADVAIILVDATCSAEAIARRKDRKMASVYIRQHL
jgi:N-acyl-D-amino-acid deacylase